MSIKKVSFGTTKIQQLRRVALDAHLLETLGLEIGDTVRVELDIEHETVLITRVDAAQGKQVERKATRRGRA